MRSKITRLLVLWIGVFLSFSLTRTNRFTSSFGANFDFGKSVISYYNTRNKHNATKFHEDVIRDIQAVVNESTIIAWKAKDFFQFTELFDHDDVNNDNKTQYQPVWSDESRYFIHTMSGVCRVSQQFKETGSIKRHILLSHFNENWGALSTPVPNRTVNWGKLEDHWKQEGCNKTDIMEYLNHERMLAVFTTQHQAFDHPKVHSIPLGIGNPPLILNEMPKIPVQEERSELLMVNAAASSDRQSQIQLVLKSFHDAGYPLNNTYNIDRTITTTDSMKTYYNQMRKSKFIMCPSGMGWDTYRMWEALYLGTIPVVEKYNRQDGWHRTMDDLPIVWVDTFEDISPALLEKEYEKIVAGGSKRFKFAKLTIQYWKAFVESFLPGNATTDLTTSFDDMKKEDHPSNSSSHNNKNTVEFPTKFSWMDTTGVTLTHIEGDSRMCTDVIYTGNSLDPFKTNNEDENMTHIIQQGWKSLAHLARTSPVLKNRTCFVFFKIDSPWIDQRGRELHPVWGRLPATALVMSAFSKANVFLYMDSDALLAFPDKTPTTMYDTLAFDGYGENATLQHLTPGLIVNKPLTGWLCGQCQRFGLGHGCFNSGALLWHRSKAEVVLRAWWESRNVNESKNFYDPKSNEYFHGWSGDEAYRVGYKMGEQNRLMYVYATDPEVHGAVWPVPQQKSVAFNSESCPNAVDETHTPCLQNDFMHDVSWNESKPSCFIHHYPDDKKVIIDYAKTIMEHEYLRG